MAGFTDNNDIETQAKLESCDLRLEYSLEFRQVNPDNSVLMDAGTAVFSEDSFRITTSGKKSLIVPFRDIKVFEGKDYRIYIQLNSGSSMELYYLGRLYEDFLRVLTVLRNNTLKKDLLMHEALLFTSSEIEYTHFSGLNNTSFNGPCDAQVTETSLIIAAPDGNHIKFPLSYVSNVLEQDYKILIDMESGERLVLGMLGRQREALLLNIEGAIKKLVEKATEISKGLFPGLKANMYADLGRLFKDGRAVSKSTLDKISPALWPSMEKQLDTCGLSESYRIIKAYASENDLCIGIKRGLLGELTGSYVWFMVPIKGQNMIAMEAGTTDGSGGKATYFFNAPESNEGVKSGNIIELINYCLFMINFRREPIYLTQEQLNNPKYENYRYAVEKLPALRKLRELFIGRVVHNSQEQWQKEVSRLVAGK